MLKNSFKTKPFMNSPADCAVGALLEIKGEKLE